MVPLHFLTTIMPFMSRCQRSSLHGISKCREREEMWKIKMKKKNYNNNIFTLPCITFSPHKGRTLLHTHAVSR